MQYIIQPMLDTRCKVPTQPVARGAVRAYHPHVFHSRAAMKKMRYLKAHTRLLPTLQEALTALLQEYDRALNLTPFKRLFAAILVADVPDNAGRRTFEGLPDFLLKRRKLPVVGRFIPNQETLLIARTEKIMVQGALLTGPGVWVDGARAVEASFEAA